MNGRHSSGATAVLVATLSAILLSLAAIAVAAPAAAAGITMTGFVPTSGPVGTTVTITGTGLRSGDPVSFDGTSNAASEANRAGTTLKTFVPAHATSGAVTVTDPTTGQTVGVPGTTFEVTTGVFASPHQLWPGGTLTFFGSGLPPDRAERVFIGKTQVTTVRTGANGDFRVGVTVPWDAPSGQSSIYLRDVTVGRVSYGLVIFADWPSLRRDELNSGSDPYEPSLSTATVGRLKPRWSFYAARDLTSGPVVADGRVYVGGETDCGYFCEQGAFAAFDADTGGGVWTIVTSPYDENPWTPAVANGVMFGEDVFGTLFALNAGNGATLWTAHPPVADKGFIGAPNASNGIVYIGSGGGTLYALDAGTGHPVWTFAGAGGSPVPIANGLVYALAAGGNLDALDASSGALVWSKPGGGGPSPAVANGVVYAAGGDGVLRARNASTGALVWKFSVPNASAPSVADGAVLVSTSSSVKALDAATGAVEWSHPLGTSGSDPAVANGVVYVGAGDGSVRALDASNGQELWSSGAIGFSAGPAIAHGKLYFIAGHNLNAYGLPTRL